MYPWNDNDLDPEQLAAVLEPGNVLVVACPGSGKTRTLSFKIAYELSNLKAARKRIIAITYTTRAAEEIHERIRALGVETTQLWIGTIHAFCLEWVLRPYGAYHRHLSAGFRVIDPRDAESVLHDLCKTSATRITPWDCGYQITKDGKYILKCPSAKRPAVKLVMAQYFKYLRDNRQVDFELMLYYAYQIITEAPVIAGMLAKIFDLVLIDEYQDTKEIQYEIVAAIVKAGRGTTRLFVVGDPNQSIFMSLGGYPIEVGDLEKLAQVKIKPLSIGTNYRSSARIVEYFGNFNVHQTSIQAGGEHRDYASVVSYNTELRSRVIEDEIVRLIKFNVEKGIDVHEICVLAPQWMPLASTTRILMARLPDYTFDGPGASPFTGCFENFWFKVARLFLTQPSPQMFGKRLRWAREVLRELTDAGCAVHDLRALKLLRTINSISSTNDSGLDFLADVFSQLFQVLEIDYSQFPALSEHYEAFFKSIADKIDKCATAGAECVGDVSGFRRMFSDRKGIVVSTVHGIKGDEYDSVIAFGLLEGMIPHFSDPSPNEAARRLLYVIGSRARKNLHLISETGRKNSRGDPYYPTDALLAVDFQYDEINSSG